MSTGQRGIKEDQIISSCDTPKKYVLKSRH